MMQSHLHDLSATAPGAASKRRLLTAGDYRLVLLPDGMGWVRTGNWLGRGAPERGFIPFFDGSSKEQLEQALLQLDPSVPVHEIVLPDSELLYHLEPWPVAIASRAELDSYVRFRLRDLYGETGSAPIVVMRPVGGMLLACAWPSQSYDKWAKLFDSLSWPLPKVIPYFSALFDAVAANLSEQGWLVSIIGGAVTFVGWCDSELQSIHTLAIEPTKAQAGLLAQRLRQQAKSLTIGMGEGVWLHAYHPEWHALLSEQGIRTRSLTPRRAFPWVVE
jgi:hypothetical protein